MTPMGLALLNINKRFLTREDVQREYGADLLEGAESHGYVTYRAQRVVLTERGARRVNDEG